MKIKLEWDKDTKYFMIIMAGVLLLAIGICGEHKTILQCAEQRV